MTTRLFVSLALPLGVGLMLAACGDDEEKTTSDTTSDSDTVDVDHDGHDHDMAEDDASEEDGHEHDAEQDTGEETQAVEINFSLVFGDTEAACGAAATVGNDATEVTLTDARLYVHDLVLVNAAGEDVALEMPDDGAWQHHDTVLLDFEDATAPCLNGNELVNTVAYGTVPPGEYTGIKFKVGVPFHHNHEDVTLAEPPFNYSSMFWNWQGGYKFVRFETDNGADGLILHLGSTGCEGTPGNISGCSHPNRPEVSLENFDPTTDEIAIDLSALWANVAASTNLEGTPPGCMSGPTDTDCDGVWPALGLDADGNPVAGQTLFKVHSHGM